MKKIQRAEVNNFIKGLVTEASPLNYPANASIAEENYELSKDGTRARRLGMDYETGYTKLATTLSAVDLSDSKIESFKWLSVNGNSEKDFLVVQLEQTLKFFDLSSEILSTDGYIGEVVLSSFPVNTAYSFASVEGSLIVAAGVNTVAVISYVSSAFSVEYKTLKVRDFWGAQVTGIPSYESDSSYRGVYDSTHYYNLQNQSWGIPRKNSAGTLIDPINQYFTDLGVYPSNSETVWAGLQFQPITGGATFERIYTNLYTEVLGASVIASKGYYVIDVLNRGSSRMSEFAKNYSKYSTALTVPSITLPADSTAGGAKIVTEFAGRVWYSGFEGEVTNGDSRSPNLSNYLLFSQLVRDKTNLDKCYQEGDPSSRENTEVIDTDGGFIRIAGAKKIIGMVNLDASLVVIADNGVWSITGGGDYGFTATNYKVSRLSVFGGISSSSIVVEGGRVFFWSEDGIYVVAKDNTLGILGVKNITVDTIQTAYEAIPNLSKEEVKGTYDPNSKKIRWLYNQGIKFTSTSDSRELVLDITIDAFYINTIKNLSGDNVEAVGLFSSTPFQRGLADSIVYSSTDPVISVTDDVVVSESIRSTGLQSIRYIALELVSNSVFLTFSYYKDPQFLDWKSVDGVGVDAKAFLLSGQQTAGDSAVSKQIPYLIMHFRRTEDGVDSNLVPVNTSGCLFRCQWAFSNTINSKKWSPLQQAYRYRRAQYVVDEDDAYDNGFELVTSKNKVRGRGPAFALYFETEPLKDCQIVGWSISLNGNANV